MNLQDKTVLVLGMGETGLSMIKWLTRQGAIVRVADSRAAPPNLDAIQRVIPISQIFTGKFVAKIFSRIDLIAVSPGITLAEPLMQDAVKRGVSVVGDIELFAQAIRRLGRSESKILGITGSNGKTTVTAMVGAMAKKAGCDAEVAGNIGPAALDALMRREDSGKFPQVWVLELSSFQLETTRSLSPDAATVLNLCEDHLDRYVGMPDYVAAKERIFLSEVTGTQVLNRDDPMVRVMAVPGRKQITFGLGEPVSENDFGLLHEGGDTWLVQGRTRLMRTSELNLIGQHNVVNALAALGLCRAIELPFGSLLQALREFKGLPHRVEKVATFGGVTFYDDSKGTNVGATVAALNGMTQRVVLIAGGDGKGQDFTPLKHSVVERARAVVLIGRDAKKIEAALAGCIIPVHQAKTMEEAVQKSFMLAEQGDVVLMSPACASLDMFRNYAHRAEVFVTAVRDLAARIPAKIVQGACQ